MSFFQKLMVKFRMFMAGRYGVDQLSTTLIYGALIVMLLAMIPYLSLLTFVADAMLIWAFFRMLSKNSYKRGQENVKFLSWFTPLKTRFSQGAARFKNRKSFRYFRCPQCKSYLKLPRGTGNVTVTCGKCGHKFSQHG